MDRYIGVINPVEKDTRLNDARDSDRNVPSSPIPEKLPRPPPGFDYSYSSISSSISSATVTPANSPKATKIFNYYNCWGKVAKTPDQKKSLPEKQENSQEKQTFHQSHNITPFSYGLKDWKGLPMIVKLTNISWEISKADVLQFVKGIDIGNIHIPIDRSTGKTKNQVFVEIYTGLLSLELDPLDHKNNCETLGIPATLELRNGEVVKGRSIVIQRSSWAEMMTCHFPNASPLNGSYLTRDEITSILNICRNYKIHFSRKCAQRPFEHVASIIQLIPYHRLTTVSRDHMFEFAKLTIESLKGHLCKPACQIDKSLLDYLHKTCLNVKFFTDRQKSVLTGKHQIF